MNRPFAFESKLYSNQALRFVIEYYYLESHWLYRFEGDGYILYSTYSICVVPYCILSLRKLRDAVLRSV